MSKQEAEKFLREQLEKYAQKARAAKTDEELMKFTDEAHKLYITLATYGGFETDEPYAVSRISQ